MAEPEQIIDTSEEITRMDRWVADTMKRLIWAIDSALEENVASGLNDLPDKMEVAVQNGNVVFCINVSFTVVDKTPLPEAFDESEYVIFGRDAGRDMVH